MEKCDLAVHKKRPVDRYNDKTIGRLLLLRLWQKEDRRIYDNPAEMSSDCPAIAPAQRQETQWSDNRAAVRRKNR